MLSVPMRTFPGLFVGRRTVVPADSSARTAAEGLRFVCGACDDVIFSAKDRQMLSDMVVRCTCGELNQL